MAKSLKETLREIQILLGKPHRKIAGAFKYYLNFLSPAENGIKKEVPEIKEDKIQSLKSGKITWVDVKDPNRREISKLAEHYPFHPLHLEDCISKGQFPKIEQSAEDKYIFLLLRFPSFSSHEGAITINQICFFLGDKYLVTLHDDGNNMVSRIFKDCKENPDERKVYIGNSSAHMLYSIIEQLSDNLVPLLSKILSEVDEVEDIVFDDKVSGVYKVGQLRRKIVSLRRTIGPLKALLAEMETRVNNFTKKNLSVYFIDIAHRVDKAWETLEEARETVDIYKDADFIISTEKTNRILAVLTIIFTLSIPATVIGTFYGMNVVLPGSLEPGPWTFWGQYTTLIIILTAAAIPALLMVWFFRKRGWI
ncbi:MAG: magnesium transporter CorA family protein [Candidatus Daviesbacteria bacterium]|nr:magnesium transporter CorA family protein [Candidatus Daviesbacteria bacterium]